MPAYQKHEKNMSALACGYIILFIEHFCKSTILLVVMWLWKCGLYISRCCL